MRPGKGEIFINLVGRAATNRAHGRARRSPRSPRAVNTAPVGLCGLLIQIDPGPRRDRRGEGVEVGTKAGSGRADGDHVRAAGADHDLIGGVDRLGHDGLVARPGEALQRAVEAALGPGHDDDVVGGAGLAGAPRDPRRDRLAQPPDSRWSARNRCRWRNESTVASMTGGGRRLVGIADGQEDDVVARPHAGASPRCGSTRRRRPAGDAVDQRREAHAAVQLNSRAAAPAGRRRSLAPIQAAVRADLDQFDRAPGRLLDEMVAVCRARFAKVSRRQARRARKTDVSGSHWW